MIIHDEILIIIIIIFEFKKKVEIWSNNMKSDYHNKIIFFFSKCLSQLVAHNIDEWMNEWMNEWMITFFFSSFSTFKQFENDNTMILEFLLLLLKLINILDRKWKIHKVVCLFLMDFEWTDVVRNKQTHKSFFSDQYKKWWWFIWLLCWFFVLGFMVRWWWWWKIKEKWKKN